MTLTIIDMLLKSKGFRIECIIPEKGELSRELEKRGIQYTLLGNQEMRAGSKGVFEVVKYCKLTLRAMVVSRRTLKKGNIDVIYAPGPAALPWSAITGEFAHIPVVWHLHHNFIDKKTKILLNITSKWRQVKKIICVSESVSGAFSSKIRKEKSTVLYNPIDTEKYRNGKDESVGILLSEYVPLDSSAIRILHIGVVEPEKRQETTILAIKELVERGINAYGLFAGSVKKGEERYKEHLDAVIHRLGMDKHIVFLGYRNDIPKILEYMEYVIVPSLEGFPLAALEACASGVPIVGADIGGAKELIQIGQVGRIFKYGDSTDAANAIEALVKNTSTEKMLLAENCLRFANKLSFEKYEREIRRILLEAV